MITEQTLSSDEKASKRTFVRIEMFKLCSELKKTLHARFHLVITQLNFMCKIGGMHLGPSGLYELINYKSYSYLLKSPPLLPVQNAILMYWLIKRDVDIYNSSVTSKKNEKAPMIAENCLTEIPENL